MSLIRNSPSNPLIIPFVEVVAKAISFVNILLLIRIFSIDEYADYSYLISIILWASVLMDSGINDLIYNKSLHKDLKGLNSLYTSKVFLSLIVVIFLGIYFSVKDPDFAIPGILLSFVILLSSLSALFKMFSRGNGYTDVDIFTILSEPIIRLVFLMLVFISRTYFSWQFWQVILIYLLAGFLVFHLNSYRLSRYFKFKLKIKKPNTLFKEFTQTIFKTKYFLLYYLMLIGIQRIDIILIENYCIKSELAIFSSSITLFQVAYLFFFSLITSKFLVFLENPKYLIKYLTPALIILILLSWFLSPYIYKYLFPVEYAQGSQVFNYLIISIIPSAFSLYFILKNNYYGKPFVNFTILSFALLLKIFIYNTLKSDSLETYYLVYILVESLLLILFLFYNFVYARTSDK